MVVQPNIPLTSCFLSGKCGSFEDMEGNDFSRSFDSKCFQIQGIQVARSRLYIKNKAISKEPWEIWPSGSACCIYSMIKCCASAPEPTVSWLNCSTWISACLNDKFSAYISAEKADWQITSQTTRKEWHAELGLLYQQLPEHSVHGSTPCGTGFP